MYESFHFLLEIEDPKRKKSEEIFFHFIFDYIDNY